MPSLSLRSDGFLIQSVHDTMPSDLLVLEIGDDTIRDFDTLNRAKATNKAREFFITCKSTNPDVLIQALRIGVKEFIPQPVNEAELRKALLRLRDGSEHSQAAAQGTRAQGADHQCPGRQGRRRDDDDRREPRRQPRAARRDALGGHHRHEPPLRRDPALSEPRARLQLGGRLEEHRPPRRHVPHGDPLPAPLGAAGAALAGPGGRQVTR